MPYPPMLTLAFTVKPHTRLVPDVSGQATYDDQIRARLDAVPDEALLGMAGAVGLDYLTWDVEDEADHPAVYRRYVAQALDDLIFHARTTGLPEDATDLQMHEDGPMYLFAGNITDGSHTDTARQVLAFDALGLFDEPFRTDKAAA